MGTVSVCFKEVEQLIYHWTLSSRSCRVVGRVIAEADLDIVKKWSSLESSNHQRMHVSRQRTSPLLHLLQKSVAALQKSESHHKVCLPTAHRHLPTQVWVSNGVEAFLAPRFLPRSFRRDRNWGPSSEHVSE